ncbi:inositol monophosphatase family protein [Salisediminibacterium halotolerans]|uniref:inositol monophosphatase family protein n=1 Tax=Salisediminibacterium halotolerans TaxID=517425 RepID=UPI000F278E4E|nr:inositol monophosphatase family protein [Salisediminibacterium halotolerans]RLJ74345.1 myo-inositol-1(or 4)-monophosphatase [Actinophytocola xinjiangensis]RPE87562.1 myo-inositol-1(or 4)-monophosphatase [Salisediminibacterium halotolerans]TWG35182.1 myo-inositol-1(or 4)-monophosphatase [Salisediminibacterium halotolerans]GEL08880.1 inositol-1-monophosphatase [Salisediminibacterium halotolerans]
MIESSINMNEIKDIAESWTYEAAAKIKREMNESYSVDTKADEHDLVTEVDKSIETFFADKIAKQYPGHRLMGEEGSFKDIHDLNGIVWILDPIDGTVNFVHQRTGFAISIGVYQNGEPLVGIVYDVIQDEMFSSVKGQGAFLNGVRLADLYESRLDRSLISFNSGWVLQDRRLEALIEQARGMRSYGAAALEIAYVACGRLDAYISFNLAPWDIAGGCAILREVGGVASDYEGKELSFMGKGTFLAANPGVYKEILHTVHTS